MLDLTDIYKEILESENNTPSNNKKGVSEPNENAKKMLQKRTKVIINPSLKEDDKLENDPSKAVSDPYGTLGNAKASVELKDLAYKLIKARTFD